MIEERMVDVAVCDACGHRDYSDFEGNFFDSNGYTLTIVQHATDRQQEVVACKETHIGKAARAVLDQWRAEENPPLQHASGPLALDAPPLPERDDTPADDTEAVTS